MRSVGLLVAAVYSYCLKRGLIRRAVDRNRSTYPALRSTTELVHADVAVIHFVLTLTGFHIKNEKNVLPETHIRREVDQINRNIWL
jgi:hypothetical protein